MSNKKLSHKKIEKAYSELLDVFSKHKLNVRELLTVYGNLGYALGASIGNHPNTVTTEQLELKYYTNPTIDIALMLQGLTVASWVNDLDKTVEGLKKEKKETNK